MAHLGVNKEKRNYNNNPYYVFPRSYKNHTKRPSLGSRLQSSLEEISFHIHEYKNLGCCESSESEETENSLIKSTFVMYSSIEDDSHYGKIKKALYNVYANEATFSWYSSLYIDKEVLKEYNYIITTLLGDKVYIRHTNGNVIFYIE